VAAAGYSAVLDGQDNQVCDQNSSIAGGGFNAISSGSDSADLSFIGGGSLNVITGTAEFAVIGGGNENMISGSSDGSFIGGGYQNQSTGIFAFVGAGSINNVSGTYGAISGGESNTASGDFTFIGAGYGNTVSAKYAAIAGGEYNAVSGKGAYVGGGGDNTASGEGAIVDGGYNDTASGPFATIPGGYEDSAGGAYSFAAGAYANAPQAGTFVWSDGSNGSTPLTPSAAYQFVARASGGVTFWTNAGATVGAQLAAGSGTWASLSDRDAKTNIVPLDDATVLQKVASLPISRWSYRTEHGVRHVGPMAQDFYAAFKVGEDDRHITSIDEDGVALAAIKALHRDNEALHAENVQLRAQLANAEAAQRAQNAATRQQIEGLKAAVAALGTR
jgi:hypothetical protein